MIPLWEPKRPIAVPWEFALEGSEDFFDRLHRFHLHRRQHMRIGIERDPDARVAEAFRHDLGMDPLLQHQGRVRVPQVMETRGRQPSVTNCAAPSSRKRVRVHRFPVGVILHMLSGSAGSGVLLDQSLHDTAGFTSATKVSIDLPGDAPQLSLSLPETGTLDYAKHRPGSPFPTATCRGTWCRFPGRS